MGHSLGFICAFLLGSTAAIAQQVPDTEFHFANANPAYPQGSGPQVCMDGAHHNFHTLEGRYLAFGRLLREDGYQVRELSESFSREVLDACKVVVIAGAADESNTSGQAFPHASAFSKEELNVLMAWIHDGGSLLLIADHPPYAGAAFALATMLGFDVLDGYAGSSLQSPTSAMIFGDLDEEVVRKSAEALGAPAERFRQLLGDPGKLGSHAILAGRNERERITSVATFTGCAFHPSTRIQPLLILGPKAGGAVNIGQNLQGAQPDDIPLFSLGGWLQGGALRFGRGRVVMLGEAAMCSAQRAGPQHTPMGMNIPLASQNPQFCLNIVHWLSGVLEPPEPQQ